MPTHHFHLDMRNNYEHKDNCALPGWFPEGWCFVALWDVQEIKVNNKNEVVSTFRLELEAEIL